MDVARLNYSHGTPDEHAATTQRLRDAAGRAGRPIAILQDLPGPKLRIGPLVGDIVELKPGDRVTFDCDGAAPPGTEARMSISWAGLAEALAPGEVLYLADGSVRLRVVVTRPGDGEIDAARRGRRCRRVAPGREHPRPGRHAPQPAGGGPRPAAPRREHRRGPGRPVLRAQPRRRHGGAQAHPHAPHREDREASGRRARRRDPACGRLRDDRPWRPRHRDAHRGGADRPEAAPRPRRRARRGPPSPPRRCWTRW